jgi:hypothetical protein
MNVPASEDTIIPHHLPSKSLHGSFAALSDLKA